MPYVCQTIGNSSAGSELWGREGHMKINDYMVKWVKTDSPPTQTHSQVDLSGYGGLVICDGYRITWSNTIEDSRSLSSATLVQVSAKDGTASRLSQETMIENVHLFEFAARKKLYGVTHPYIGPGAMADSLNILRQKARQMVRSDDADGLLPENEIAYHSFRYHPTKNNHFKIKYDFDQAEKPIVTIDVDLKDAGKFSTGYVTYIIAESAWKGSGNPGQMPDSKLLEISNKITETHPDEDTTASKEDIRLKSKPTTFPSKATGPIVCISSTLPYEFKDNTPLPPHHYGNSTSFGVLHGAYTLSPGETLKIYSGHPRIVGDQVVA